MSQQPSSSSAAQLAAKFLLAQKNKTHTTEKGVPQQTTQQGKGVQGGQGIPTTTQVADRMQQQIQQKGVQPTPHQLSQIDLTNRYASILAQRRAANSGETTTTTTTSSQPPLRLPPVNPSIPTNPAEFRKVLGLQDGDLLVMAFNKKLSDFLADLSEAFSEDDSLKSASILVGDCIDAKDPAVRSSLITTYWSKMEPYVELFEKRTAETEAKFLTEVIPKIDMLKQMDILKKWAELEDPEKDKTFEYLSGLNDTAQMYHSFDNTVSTEMENVAFTFISQNSEMLAEAGKTRDLTKIPLPIMTLKVLNQIQNNPVFAPFMPGADKSQEAGNPSDNPFLNQFSASSSQPQPTMEEIQHTLSQLGMSTGAGGMPHINADTMRNLQASLLKKK